MPRRTMQGHTSRVRGVLHLRNGQHIITCSDDTSLRLCDLESGAQMGDNWRDEGDTSVMSSIDLSPHDNTVVSGSTDGKVRLWDVETGKIIARLIGHTAYVECADGERIVSGSNDGRAIVWDIKTGYSTHQQSLPLPTSTF